ncbi:metal ABC transporter substrate-binding protein [Canibacter zhuwentaonis]|uniref:metal ABC transporter substrate-binding protein n=1 Tax=Canibacter zhuwentaonis TaxID=2837491 RepID=UPI002027D789|nr:metal ABC transporter substrate-binding protein [Canibacter zhuwentaonis]
MKLFKTKKARKKLYALTLICGMVAAITSCSAETKQQGTSEQQLKLFATSGYIGDALSNIAPNATVTTLVGPGGDPHTYQPTTKDIEKMRASDLVVHNGLNLEAQMTAAFRPLGERQLELGKLVPVENLIKLDEAADEEGQYDPHIWNDPRLWASLIPAIADKIAKIDPAHASDYKANATKYQGEIMQAHMQAQELLAQVSAPRVLVTGHDAFNYFGRTYNLEVLATDYISTEASLSVQQMKELADTIAAKKIPTIFMDSQANPQAIKSLQESVTAKGWHVHINEQELYADTLSADDSANTYTKALLHNAREIAKALAPAQ